MSILSVSDSPCILFRCKIYSLISCFRWPVKGVDECFLYDPCGMILKYPDSRVQMCSSTLSLDMLNFHTIITGIALFTTNGVRPKV